MWKRLIIPGLTLSALTLSATSSLAASFVVDSYNSASQTLAATRNSPLRTNLATNVPNVLGGSRRLTLNWLSASSDTLDTVRTSINLSNSSLDIVSNPGVTSRTILRYDRSGLGLGSAGNWLSGNNSVDWFEMGIINFNVDTTVTFRIANGPVNNPTQIAEVTRQITVGNNGSLSINNPTNIPGLTQIPGNTAIFGLMEFLAANPNINLSQVSFAEFRISGGAGLSGSIDFIRGVEIPEPSLVIGSFVALGLGGLLTKNNQQENSED